MTIREYKEREKLSCRTLANQLKEVEPRITPSLVSNMINGVVDPTDEIKVWLVGKQIENQREKLTEAEDSVLRCLTGHSKEDPVTRGDFKYWCGLSDRVAREAIEGLRRRGYWIVNGEYGGYYITYDRNEMEEWLLQYTARARTISRVASAMRASDPKQIAI